MSTDDTAAILALLESLRAEEAQWTREHPWRARAVAVLQAAQQHLWHVEQWVVGR